MCGWMEIKLPASAIKEDSRHLYFSKQPSACLISRFISLWIWAGTSSERWCKSRHGPLSLSLSISLCLLPSSLSTWWDEQHKQNHNHPTMSPEMRKQEEALPYPIRFLTSQPRKKTAQCKANFVFSLHLQKKGQLCPSRNAPSPGQCKDKPQTLPVAALFSPDHLLVPGNSHPWNITCRHAVIPKTTAPLLLVLLLAASYRFNVKSIYVLTSRLPLKSQWEVGL